MKKALILLSLILSVNFLHAIPPECRGRENDFQSEINQFSESALIGKTLFAGSSSIRLWSNIHDYFDELYLDPNGDTNYLNRGFGGSEICHLILNVDKIFFSLQSMPEKIVLYSGDNDLAGGLSTGTIVNHYRDLIQSLRERRYLGPIYIITVKPSPARLDLEESIQILAQQMLSDLSNLDNVYIINPIEEFYDSFGNLRSELYLEDGLHLSSEAYRIWASELSAIW